MDRRADDLCSIARQIAACVENMDTSVNTSTSSERTTFTVLFTTTSHKFAPERKLKSTNMRSEVRCSGMSLLSSRTFVATRSTSMPTVARCARNIAEISSVLRAADKVPSLNHHGVASRTVSSSAYFANMFGKMFHMSCLHGLIRQMPL